MGIVEIVLSDKKISQASEEELKDKLKIVYTMIGLREKHLPVKEEKKLLHNYIFLKYGNKTLSEILLAFDLAIQGRLNVDDVKVYDQFSCEYFARIMNGYRLWLNEVNKNIITFKKENIKMLDDKKELTNDEWEEWLNDIKNYKMEFIPIPTYDYLLRTKKINPTPTEKKEYMEKAISKYIVRIQDNNILYPEFVKMRNENKIAEPHTSSLVVISKQMIVFDFLNQQK